MKFIETLTLLTLALTPAAFAAPRSVSNSFELLKADAKFAVSIFEYQSDVCDLRVEETREGITISVKAGGSPAVLLDVGSESEIKIVDLGQDSPDGSFAHQYTVDNRISFKLVHVDDAYDHLYISKDGKTTSCELDY